MVYLLSIVFSILLWWANPAYVAAAGNTYYVRTGGSDSHSCTQARTDNDANALASIQAGVNCVQGPGDSVVVHGGTYATFSSATEIPSTSGSDLGAGAITLKAAPGETVWLRGLLDMWNHSGEYWIIDRINVDGGHVARDTMLINPNTRVQNLEAMNAHYYGIAAGENSEFLNVRSHGHGRGPGGCFADDQGPGQCHAIYFHKGGIVDGCDLYDNDGHGVAGVYLDAGSITIRNTKIHHNTAGIQLLVIPGTSQIYNNIIYDNGNYAMWIRDGTFLVNNNTIYNNSGDAVFNDAGTSGSSIRNNIIYNNAGTITSTSGITISNNLINVYPAFANPSAGNFHLTVSSPAIDAGLTLPEVPTDFDKISRPQGRRFDIGAYEYTGSVPLPLIVPTNLRRAGQ